LLQPIADVIFRTHAYTCSADDKEIGVYAYFEPGAIPVVFGVEVIAVLFGSVLVPVSPIAAMPRTAITATAPITHVVGLIVRSVPGPGVGGTGRLIGFELS
jgi:hypothetical protein